MGIFKRVLFKSGFWILKERGNSNQDLATSTAIFKLEC
jgi:hypothetical protein